MRGVHALQSPHCLPVLGSYQSCDEKVLPSRKMNLHRGHLYSNSPGGALSFDPRLRASQLGARQNCYGQDLRWSGLQPSFLRQRDSTRNFHLGGSRKLNLIKEERSSVRITRCDSSDSEAVSTTTSSNSEEQQQTSSSENSISDGVEQGLAMKSGLSALDAYFSKLQGSATGGTEVSNATVPSSPSKSAVSVLAPPEVENSAFGSGVTSSAVTNKTVYGRDVQGLKALDAYFDKLKPKKPEPVKDEVEKQPDKAVELTEEELFLKALLEAKEEYDKNKASQESSETKLETAIRSEEDGDELDLSEWEQEGKPTTSSDLINLVVAVNIAVYLFGLASPHEAFGIRDFSLPFVYGAKVNDLIVAGQWWRLITPMFLHASLLHVGLGSWALLSFGPAVESAYGTFGFAMIYFLGGIFGNLMSFFHTNEWTVGGTGPIYALVGTWLVYLLKNRETIGTEIADDMIRKVIILSALNVALWNSLPVDDWTHLGAVLVGLLFGVLASPTMQLNLSLKELDPDSKEEMGEAFLWFNEGLSPARLTLVFVMCLGIFYGLYQLAVAGYSDLYLLQDTDVFS